MMTLDYEEEDLQNGDHLHFGENSQIRAWLCSHDRIVFSFEVMKKNRFKIWQRRSIMLTTENLVNIRSKDNSV